MCQESKPQRKCGNRHGGARHAPALQARGLAVATVRVARPDWLRNAAGLASASYWRGTLQPRPTVNWCPSETRSPTSCVLLRPGTFIQDKQGAVVTCVQLFAHEQC